MCPRLDQTLNSESVRKDTCLDSSYRAMVCKPEWYVYVLASLSLILAAAAAVYSFYEPIVLILALLLGSAGIPVAFFTRSRYVIDDEKILYKNPLGRITQIFWRDVRSVYYNSAKSKMLVRSTQSIIPVYMGFNGFYRMLDIINDRCRHAFTADSVLDTTAAKTKDFNIADGTAVFKFQTTLTVFSVMFSLISIGVMILLAVLPAPKHISWIQVIFLMLFILAPIIFLFHNLAVKLIIKSEYIVKRSLFGAKIIRWSEMKSVIFSVENIKLTGDGKSIKITRNFSGYEVIQGLVEKYIQEEKHG